MNRKSLFTVLAIVIAVAMSCKKEDKCIAGSNGSVTITLFPEHHNLPVVSDDKPGYADTAFVKFSPAPDFVPTANPADYDLVVVGDAGTNDVFLQDLHCGDYFIFITGFAVSLNARVKGGIPYSFSQTIGNINLVVPLAQ